MTGQIDLYWSFRSPYCYLLGCQIEERLARFDVSVRVRPVYPAAVRSPDFFARVDPLWFRYFALDVRRSAEMLGVPIRWPVPDPVDVEPGSQRPTADQSRIRRLTALGVAADDAGRGLAFVRNVGDTLWRGEIDGWDTGDHIAHAAARAGLKLGELERHIARDPGRFELRISENEAAQREAGHWGVPLMVFNGEPFFGQDRLDALCWRLGRRDGAGQRA